MNPQKEFLRHANECEQMARFTRFKSRARDPESRITWNRMAERWRQCVRASPCYGSARGHKLRDGQAKTSLPLRAQEQEPGLRGGARRTFCSETVRLALSC